MYPYYINSMKTKVKIPKIMVDNKGRRYVMIEKKKVMLAKQISERELIRFLVNRLKPKRRTRAIKADVDTKPKFIPISTPLSNIGASVVSQLVNKPMKQDDKKATIEEVKPSTALTVVKKEVPQTYYFADDPNHGYTPK